MLVGVGVKEGGGPPYNMKCIGLGLARLLAANKSLQSGVRLLFQPAEEIAEGAKWMREDGKINP